MAKFRVKAICKEQGITLAELAERIKISPSALSQMLNGANPSLNTMERIADALNVDLTDIFERQNPSGYIIYKDETYMINSKKDIEKMLEIIEN